MAAEPHSPPRTAFPLPVRFLLCEDGRARLGCIWLRYYPEYLESAERSPPTNMPVAGSAIPRCDAAETLRVPIADLPPLSPRSKLC